MRCSSRTRRIVICLTPHDTPGAAPCNSPTFCVDHILAARGVWKLRIAAVLNYIDLVYCSGDYPFPRKMTISKVGSTLARGKGLLPLHSHSFCPVQP